MENTGVHRVMKADEHVCCDNLLVEMLNYHHHHSLQVFNFFSYMYRLLIAQYVQAFLFFGLLYQSFDTIRKKLNQSNRMIKSNPINDKEH